MTDVGYTIAALIIIIISTTLHQLSTQLYSIFTALQCIMHSGISHEISVRPSVRLSAKRVNCDKTKETSAEMLITYKRSIHLVFLQKTVGGGRPLLPEILDQTDPVASETPISNRYPLV